MYINKNEISRYLNIAKFFAILSVILAHSRNPDFGVISSITERLGSLGVACFLFISGYFYKKDIDLKTFFTKKTNTIIIPWVISGTIVYIISKKEFVFEDWGKWLIGYYTYLYYLTVLFLCFFIFYFIKNKWLLISTIFITIVSILFTYFKIWEGFSFYPDNFPPYLNILNWIGFFALGILSKEKFAVYYYYIKKYRVHIITVFLALLIFIAWFRLDKEFGYFSLWAFPMEVFGTVMIFALSTFKIFDKKFILYVAKISFTIYLYHFLAFPFRKFFPNSAYFEFLKPIYYGIICIAFIYGVMWVAKKIKLEDFASKILGIRK